uniref:Uncharacterized protein n=1 Tax=Arundo donax TaxID=35708 RepID=A0A0A9F8C3_ARUDO
MLPRLEPSLPSARFVLNTTSLSPPPLISSLGAFLSVLLPRRGW